MKIYYDNYFKDKYASQMIKRFPEIEFVNQVELSYDAEAILAMPGFLVPKNLDLYLNLKWVQVLTAGYDTLDLDYFKSRKIILTNAKDVFSIQIAEDVFSKILYFNRTTKLHLEHMAKGEWKYEPVHYEIAQSTVGILGTGSIGLEIAKRMKAFDAKVIGYKRSLVKLPYFDEIYHTDEGLKQLYETSDYIIVSLPLNSKTFHMIDETSFKLMKESAIFINIARGDIVDQKALIHALENHLIRGAGLDVMSPEPLPKNHVLWSMDNVFITPHNASSSPHVNQRLIDATIDSISRYINNQVFDNRVV
ncbi:MAG: D-2-hydroxyacid dehydrogenase [Firmicutes bacterium]|nr:D-2-hydroxyacid dehydrogenase [Bacillota bacterium]